MKMLDKINDFRKEFVFEQYTRIICDFKDYEKISKKKMLEAIYKLYSDYENIIDICTVRELKFLKKIIDSKQADTKENNPQLFDDKYGWERNSLRNKFLIFNDFNGEILIPEEIEDYVKKAVTNVNWSLHKDTDYLNEILVSLCKMQGTAFFKTIAILVSSITDIDEERITAHMLDNKLFNYYVSIVLRDDETLGEDTPVLIYQDFYYIEDKISLERKKQGLAGVKELNYKYCKTLFYNDFDINNTKIKKFLEELKKLPFLWYTALDEVRYFAMLNIDRKPLKDAISNVGSLRNIDLSKFFKLMDDAMDEMPSGALNGFTPNEAKKIREEEKKVELSKEKNYVKQKNACLSEEDAKLFYKIYFALLEFTNKKYKINPKLKIYKAKSVNPSDVISIIDAFWKDKDSLILEFCTTNPYKFNEEELELTREFSKGIRGLFVIGEFEEDYTAFMDIDKVYMVKGIYDNIDTLVSYKQLPYITLTSIIPFKGVLIYDGILLEMSVDFGNNFAKTVEEELERAIKYYHL